jgi:hypothetical protein
MAKQNRHTGSRNSAKGQYVPEVQAAARAVLGQLCGPRGFCPFRQEATVSTSSRLKLLAVWRSLLSPVETFSGTTVP